MKKVLLTSVFVFGLMLSGSTADALTAKTSMSAPTLQYTETLRRGAKNQNVLALQKKLKEFGYYNKALDSDYGSGTIAAVKQYQRSKGLVPDGNAGPKTYAMILADNSKTILSATDSISKPNTNTSLVSSSAAFNSGDCLQVEAAANPSPGVTVGQDNRIIGMYNIHNLCDEELDITGIDFNVLSSYGKNQFNDITVLINDYHFDDNGIINNSYNSWIGGQDLGFTADSGSDYTLDDGGNANIAVIGDIIGAYTPWNGQSSQSTAFAIAIKEIAYEYEGDEEEWGEAPVWGNLVEVYYSS